MTTLESSLDTPMSLDTTEATEASVTDAHVMVEDQPSPKVPTDDYLKMRGIKPLTPKGKAGKKDSSPSKSLHASKVNTEDPSPVSTSTLQVLTDTNAAAETPSQADSGLRRADSAASEEPKTPGAGHATAEEELVKVKASNDKMKKEVELRRKQVSDLEAKLEESKQIFSIQDLKNELKNKEREIEHMKKEVKTLEIAVKRQDKIIVKREGEDHEISEMEKKYEDEIRALKNQLKELQRQKHSQDVASRHQEVKLAFHQKLFQAAGLKLREMQATEDTSNEVETPAEDGEKLAKRVIHVEKELVRLTALVAEKDKMLEQKQKELNIVNHKLQTYSKTKESEVKQLHHQLEEAKAGTGRRGSAVSRPSTAHGSPSTPSFVSSPAPKVSRPATATSQSNTKATVSPAASKPVAAVQASKDRRLSQPKAVVASPSPSSSVVAKPSPPTTKGKMTSTAAPAHSQLKSRHSIAGTTATTTPQKTISRPAASKAAALTSSAAKVKPQKKQEESLPAPSVAQSEQQQQEQQQEQQEQQQQEQQQEQEQQREEQQEEPHQEASEEHTDSAMEEAAQQDEPTGEETQLSEELEAHDTEVDPMVDSAGTESEDHSVGIENQDTAAAQPIEEDWTNTSNTHVMDDEEAAESTQATSFQEGEEVMGTVDDDSRVDEQKMEDVESF
eukprot:GILK01002233.1.p1 GENE.GILK01002233.1~~GILK01002233.1.p1  ORF type:complete len:673 (+),score=194.91 GILK01002233.1:62-2080(+)